MGVRRVESSLQSQRQVALAPDAGTVVPGRRLPSGGSRFQVLILKIDSIKSPSRSCGNDDEDFCLFLKHLLDVVVMLLGCCCCYVAGLNHHRDRRATGCVCGDRRPRTTNPAPRRRAPTTTTTTLPGNPAILKDFYKYPYNCRRNDHQDATKIPRTSVDLACFPDDTKAAVAVCPNQLLLLPLLSLLLLLEE